MGGRDRGIVVIALACALLLAGCVAGTAQPAPVRPASPPAAGPAQMMVPVGDRPVQLYVPASRPIGVPAALVVVLHGYTGEADGAVRFFGLRHLADQRGFLVAAPQGTTDSEGHTFWNASKACCNFGGSAVDDSAYLSQVITTIVSTQGVDPARVYVAGHSNGGFMAHRLACEHADQVAAIASLAGALDSEADCSPSRPVSVLQIHGTADETILYDGGAIEGRRYTSAAETAAQWRRSDGCRSGVRSGERFDADADAPGDDLRPTTWTPCDAGTEVALWSITDGRHSPALTPAFAAELFDWFEAHQRT